MLVPWTWDQALDGLLLPPPAFLVCWQDAECQPILSGILSLRQYARTLLPRYILAAVDIARATCGRTQWTSDDHDNIAHDFLWQLCMACYDVYLKGDLRVMHAPLHRIRLSDLNCLDKRRALDLTVEVASMKWSHLHGVSWLERARGGWNWDKVLDSVFTPPSVFAACWANPKMHSVLAEFLRLRKAAMSFKLGRPHLHLLATAKIARHMALGRDSLQQPLLHELVDLLLCELHSALWCEHLRLKIDIRHQTWAAIVLDAAAQVADLMHVHLPVDRDSRLDSLTERAETLSLAITTNVERVRGQQSLLTQIRRQQLQLLALFDEGEVHDPQWTPELKFVNKGSRDMIRAFLSKLEASRRGEGRGTLFMDLADLSLREMHRPVYYGIDHAGRLSNTRRFKGLALVGAAIMLAERWPPVRVVERLEHARGIFWESTLQMRSSSLDALPPHYRATLLELFDSLERGNRPAPGGLERGPVELPLWQEERDRLNNLVDDLVVTEIRCLPGLERFLAPLPFLELAADLPDHGFQVILMREDMQNGEGPRCFAIILQGARGTIRTKKLEPDQARLASYIAFFKKNPESTRPQSGSNSGDAISTMPSSESRGFRIGRSHYLKTEHEKALEMLWKSFVKPIIEELSLMKQTGRQRPRVWWIPTRDLTFLPFHAAGIYKGPILERACVADYMVCSYAPTLGAIVKARRAWEPLALDRVRAVLGYAPSKGKTMYLPQAEKEVKVVAERCLQSPASVQILNNWSQPINSTQAQAHLESGASIFHLACHGKQESHPLQSYFLLEDGRLTIETLMDLNLPHATLAYLGACETAQGDHYHTDEAVHLAASMLFCGFRSVIATMWPMRDDDGPKVAEVFYDQLFKNERLDLDDIPYALDEAIRPLRGDDSPSPAEGWAAFVHMGG